MGSNLALSSAPRRTTRLSLISARRAATYSNATSHRGLTTEMLLLGSTLACIQVADGILTGLGVSQFGSSMEGNILLRALMVSIGCIPALMLVKGGSIALIAFLCRQTEHIQWLKPALYGVVALYLCFAIVPWTYLLLEQFIA